MKKPLFTGVCTALVTPFLGNAVNYPLLELLLGRQIAAGIEAVVLCGTTGESPTLSDCEKLEIFRRCARYAGGRCKIIAGTGSNDTQHAVALSAAAEAAGALSAFSDLSAFPEPHSALIILQIIMIAIRPTNTVPTPRQITNQFGISFTISAPPRAYHPQTLICGLRPDNQRIFSEKPGFRSAFILVLPKKLPNCPILNLLLLLYHFVKKFASRNLKILNLRQTMYFI